MSDINYEALDEALEYIEYIEEAKTPEEKQRIKDAKGLIKSIRNAIADYLTDNEVYDISVTANPISAVKFKKGKSNSINYTIVDRAGVASAMNGYGPSKESRVNSEKKDRLMSKTSDVEKAISKACSGHKFKCSYNRNSDTLTVEVD